MSTEKTVERERPVEPRTREAVDDSRGYRSPEVHDLGRLELIQGCCGIYLDGINPFDQLL